MSNMNHTEKKIRECLLDLRNHSRNPRHLEEIGCLIRENLNRVKNSKKGADNELRKLPKKDVEIIENLLSCMKKTEEKKNDYSVDLNKREKKFKKTFDKDRKSKKQNRISRDAGSKQAASEMSSDKELVVLHKRPPKMKKHFRKQKTAGNVHSSVKTGSLRNVLCMPATGNNEVKDKTLKANSQTDKDIKNSANNSVKSEGSICKGKIRNRIDDIGLDSLVSELDTAVNLSKIIMKQLGGINKNKKDITSDATGDFLNKFFPKVISNCLVDSKCFNVKEKKAETMDEKMCCDSLLKCSQEIHSVGKRNSSNSRKYSKQSIARDERDMKKKLKKENSNLLDEVKSVPKTSNTDSKVSRKDLPNSSRKSKKRRSKDGMKNSDASKSTLSSSDADGKTKESNLKKDRVVLSDKTIAILKAKSKSRLQTTSGSVSEDKSKDWSFVNDDKMKSKHVGSKVKLSRHSTNNCRTSPFKNSEIVSGNNYSEIVNEEGFADDLTLNLKRNKPCTNFQLSDEKISLNYKTGLNENDTNFSSLHESVCNTSEVKSVIQRDEVNLSKLEQKSTRSSKDRIDISINKSTKNSIDNVLSVVIKHKKSVQSSRKTRKGNRFSNVYLSANKTNNTESYTIVPQSYKIEKDSYTICKNSIQSRHFGSSYSEGVSQTPLVSNTTTKMKDSELKSSTYGKQISEYRSNQSGLKQEVFRKPQTQRVHFFGKNLSRRKFKNQAVVNARENLKYINKEYISVARVKVPINFGNLNAKKLHDKSNTKLRMVRKKSSSNIGRYFYPKRNDLLENSVSVPNKVEHCETFHRRKCNFPLGKFFFHIELESKSGVKSRNHCASGDSESKFFTIIDDSSETFQDVARAVENGARVLKNKQPGRLQEIKYAECLEKEKSDLNAENFSSRINGNDEKLCNGIGNSFFTVVEENNFNKPESKTRAIKKCNFNSPELEKHNFVHVIDEIVDENKLKKTSPKENVNSGENKQNISGEAGVFAAFSDMFFEKYKNQFFMKVVDSKSEVKKPISAMVDAEIQTDSSYSTLQQLFAEELKHNRNLFIKNLDEPNNEESVKSMQAHYEDILQLVDNLFEITLSKIGCVDDEVLKKTESNTTPENDIIGKLNNIVEIVQNIDKNKLGEPNFVKVIESGNALDVRKEPEDFDKPSASQTNGSGDCMSVPLMKSQILLNQFNIYLEMVEMLKNHEDVSSDKIESLNEIRKMIDRIAGANKNCERSVENQRSTNHDLGPYSLSIKRDCRLPLVENRSNFVNVVQESAEETKYKTICRNQITVDPVYPEIEKKYPFFVVVDKNVSNSTIDRKHVGTGETPVEYGKHCRSISPDKSKNNRKKRSIDRYYLLDENIISTGKNPFFVVVDENDTSVSNRVGEEEKNVKKAPEITDRKLNTEFIYEQNTKNSENFCNPKCDGIKVRKESSSSLTIKNMYREKVKTAFFYPEKPEIREKENVEKEFFNIVKSLTYLNDGNDLNELQSNGDENNKIKENKVPVVVDNSVSVGIQTDSTTVPEEEKTAVEHCENSIHLDMLNKKVSREQGNIQNSIDHARFKEDKSVNVIFSKNTQKNEHNKTESRDITCQTSSTCVLNSRAQNSSDCKGFENERRHDETFENSKLFNSKETVRHKHTKNSQRNNVYFNSCFKKRHYNSENLNSSHVLKTENMIPDFKMKTAVDEYSKWFKNSSEQNRIGFNNMFTDYQNDDSFSFDFNEYKNEICLNDDLSYSDLDVTEEEEDSSNWLTVQNINCIQSTDDSSESIEKKVMRLQMDLRLNECLQIELSSDSTCDTFL